MIEGRMRGGASKKMMRKASAVGAAMALGSLSLLPILCLAGGQQQDDFDHPAIKYIQETPTDPISRLQQRLDSGQVHLTYNSRNGYLVSVLTQLHIPVSSQ